MGNKLQIQDLAELVADTDKCTREEADAFVDTFFETLVTALVNEKNVKVKGLGGFKLLKVSARESVDVNTGERIRIEEHTKVSFQPEQGLKSRINKPFEQFETVLVNDGVDEETMNSLDNEKVEAAAISHTALSATGKPDKLTSENMGESSPEPAVLPEASAGPDSGNASDPGSDSDDVADPGDVADDIPEASDVADSPSINEEDSSVDDKHPSSDPNKEMSPSLQPLLHSQAAELAREKKINRRLKMILLGIIVILLCSASYFAGYYRMLCPGCTENILRVIPQPETGQSVASPSVKKRTVVKSVPAVTDSREPVKGKSVTAGKSEGTSAKMPVKEATVSHSLDPSRQYRITGTLAVHEMKQGDNLFHLARQIYGSKSFATYIIRYNGIENPDMVQIGTRIKLPVLSE